MNSRVFVIIAKNITNTYLLEDGWKNGDHMHRASTGKTGAATFTSQTLKERNASVVVDDVQPADVVANHSAAPAVDLHPALPVNDPLPGDDALPSKPEQYRQSEIRDVGFNVEAADVAIDEEVYEPSDVLPATSALAACLVVSSAFAC